jgi:copper transport protein
MGTTPSLPRSEAINRLARAAGVAVLLAVALAVAAPGLTTAHAELISSTPAANASLRESPPFLTMDFSEAVDAATVSVLILDDLQRQVTGADDLQVEASGRIVAINLPPLDPGVYTVSYRVTSAVDGHVTTGSWAFLIDPTGTLPPPQVATQSGSPSGDAPTVIARWVALAGGLGLLGLPLFWIVSARPALARRSVAIFAPWGAIALAAALAFAGLASYLTLAARPFVDATGGHVGHGGGGALPLDFAAPFGATSFATAMRLAELGTGAAFLLATGRFFALDEAKRRRVTPLRDRDPLVLLLVVASAALALLGSSLAGHAAARGGVLFAGVDWLHLLAVSAWVGTLPGILMLARLARRHGDEERGLLGDALRQHSRVALTAAPIVALSGIANSPLVLGTAGGLVASAYGNVLLAKVLLFCVAVAIGAANFFLLRVRAIRRALPLIAIELAVGALAVLAASTLVTTEPAAARVPSVTRSAIGTLHLYGEVGASTVHTAVILPSPGTQHYEVSVSDTSTGGYRTDVQAVALVFMAPAASGLPERRVDLTEDAEPWTWGGTGAYTPAVGDWTLEVVVRRAGEPDESASFDLPVTEPLPPAVVPPADTGIGVPTPLGWVWTVLPAGAAGWFPTLGLLALLAGISALERAGGRSRAAAWRLVRASLASLAVVSLLGVGSRTAVEAANQAPASAVATTNPIAATADSIARGRDLYLANCAACHGTTGAGDGLSAAGMLPGPGDLSSSIPQLTDGEIAYVVASGTVATRMPGFATTLSEADRWDLVNYLRSEWRGPSP